jgi:phage gp46-like protein
VEGLQWLINDGIVASFDISTVWVKPNQLDMTITANKPNGTYQVVKLANLWNS